MPSCPRNRPGLKKKDMQQVHDHLHDAEREMFLDATPDRGQPVLSRIFDDPLSSSFAHFRADFGGFVRRKMTASLLGFGNLGSTTIPGCPVARKPTHASYRLFCRRATAFFFPVFNRAYLSNLRRNRDLGGVLSFATSLCPLTSSFTGGNFAQRPLVRAFHRFFFSQARLEPGCLILTAWPKFGGPSASLSRR